MLRPAFPSGRRNVPDSGVAPGGAEDQDDGFIERAVPSVAAGSQGPGGAAVVGAGGAELAEGNRRPARFTWSGSVRRSRACGPRRGSGLSAGCRREPLPRSGDEPPVVG